MWTQISGHVFNKSNDRHFCGVEKADGAHRVNKGKVLRRGDDHCTNGLVLLDHRQLNITCAGRHINDDVADIAPFGIDKLRQRIARHWPAPGNGLPRINQLPHRQKRHAACAHDRDHHLPFRFGLHALHTH